MSHDIDVILNYEQQKKATKRKRNRNKKSKQVISSRECEKDECSEINGSAEGDISDEKESEKSEHTLETKKPTNTAAGNHRAGFDAFMTGFCMAFYYHRFKTKDVPTFAESVPDFVNKLNLSGKAIPLKVEKSQYCKTSVNHNEAWKRVISS